MEAGGPTQRRPQWTGRACASRQGQRLASRSLEEARASHQGRRLLLAGGRSLESRLPLPPAPLASLHRTQALQHVSSCPLALPVKDRPPSRPPHDVPGTAGPCAPPLPHAQALLPAPWASSSCPWPQRSSLGPRILGGFTSTRVRGLVATLWSDELTLPGLCGSSAASASFGAAQRGLPGHRGTSVPVPPLGLHPCATHCRCASAFFSFLLAMAPPRKQVPVVP